ncbi:NAD-dependent epimerase/dehydratase family protein [Phytoactinopolyspora endophytica]|uniref:NAD-dependent epimerase/dehydratase family protein n=1 Tax=Phytoactinopolyspora endophytica TaxID=1642495 RepID=UPI00101BF44B|nr:NAD(P)-dependent oxidoreductase [Phytoactinopolyspora endophytica]
MRVFVAGASGALGRRLVPQLTARGHQVTATVRNPDRAGALRAAGVEPVVVDGLDGVAVGEAVVRAKPDAIVHQMTALGGKSDLKHFDRWFATTNRLRTEGTEHLLAAARAAGVGRFIIQSYTGWNNARTGGSIKTEDDQLDPEPAAAQRESMAAIQFLERAVTNAPLHGIVLRYGNFYGPGASDSMVELIRKRQFPIIGRGRGIWSWIHLDDAAAATVAALERGEPGVYNIVDDDPAAVADWLPHLATSVGAKRPMRVPSWVGRLLAGTPTVQWSTEARGASNEKAKRELDWRPAWSSWRDGFRHALTDARLPTDTHDPDNGSGNIPLQQPRQQ